MTRPLARRHFRRAATAFVVGAALSPVAGAAINLHFAPVAPVVSVGAPVNIELLATTSSTAPEAILALQSIFSWDTSKLQLIGSTRHASGITGGFLPDPYGINESSMPIDGQAVYIFFGPFNSSGVSVPTSGSLLVATLHFTAIAPTSPVSTPIAMLATAGSPVGATQVFGTPGANNDVTGSIAGTSVTIIPAPAAGAAVLASLAIIARRRR
jgi:hypothetical protein